MLGCLDDLKALNLTVSDCEQKIVCVDEIVHKAALINRSPIVSM